MNDTPFGSPATRRSQRILRVGLALLLLGATTGAAWWFTRSPGDAMGALDGHEHGAAPASDSARPVMLTADQRRRIGVTFATAIEAPLEPIVRVVAQVVPDESRLSLVTLRVDGWVEELFVNQTGQSVRRGDPLFTLYAPMLVSAQEELLVAGRLYHTLGATDGALQGDAAPLRDAARRRLAYWGVPEATIQAVETSGLPQRTVTFPAPATGIVMDKMVLEGQRVMAGDPLYRIADLSTVWLEGDLFEQDLPLVRLGLTATVAVEALPGEPLRGRVIYISPTVDPLTRTARVRLSLPNPGLRLKPGMYATMRFRSPGTAVVSVPRSAVLVTGERAMLFVRADDGRLMPRQVELGGGTAERVAIRSGLSAGEVVVASATFLVDAESNLGAAMAGMAGMDMGPAATSPVVPGPSDPMTGTPGMAPASRDSAAGAGAKGGANAHTNH